MREIFIKFIVIVMIIFLTGGIVYIATIDYQNEKTIEITIKDKYVKRDRDKDKYLVAGDNGETYKITDLLFKGKFNSTDLYNQLDVGNKYKITTTGFRIHFLSMYKNINKIEKIN